MIAHLDGVMFYGDATPDVTFTLDHEALDGLFGGVGVRDMSVARPVAHGRFRLTRYRDSRVLALTGLVLTDSLFAQQQEMNRLAGLLADGRSGVLTLDTEVGSRWCTVMLADAPDVSIVVPGTVAKYQLLLRADDPRLYGEQRLFSSGVANMAPGPGGFEDEWELGANALIANTTSDPTGKLVRVNAVSGDDTTRMAWGPLVPVVAGQAVQVGFRASWVEASHTTRFTAFVYWYDAHGNPVSTERTLAYDSQGKWSAVTVSESVTAPAGASQARVRFYSEINSVNSGARAFLLFDVKPVGQIANVYHHGNFPASPVVEVAGPRAAYTVTGPGGRQVVVSQALAAGQTHRIDFASGGLFRDGVRQLGGVTHYRPWTIDPGKQTAMSISSGSMTVEVTDTYM